MRLISATPGIWALKQKGSSPSRPGPTWLTSILASPLRPSDILLVKKYASCFFGTDLVSKAREPAGGYLDYHGLHDPAAACARQPSTRCRTGSAPWWCEKPRDRSAAAHEQSLFDLDAKYADVVTAEETLHYLRSIGHNLPPAR